MDHIQSRYDRGIKGPLKSQAGFSLIEAMVAMAIFVIGILGAYKMQLHAVHSNALANRVSTSVNWATYAVEELISRDYEDDALEDRTGDGFGGIDDIGEDDPPLSGSGADGAIFIQPNGDKLTVSSGNDLYSIYWNVVVGEGPGGEVEVLRDSKLIRFRVYRNGGIGSGNLYNHDFYRSRWPGVE